VGAVAKRKNSCPYQKSNPGRPARSHYTDSATPMYVEWSHPTV